MGVPWDPQLAMWDDVHTTSGLCTPSRYSLLSGRYCCCTFLKLGHLSAYRTVFLMLGWGDYQFLVESFERASGIGSGVFIEQSMVVLDESGAELGGNGCLLDGEAFGTADKDLAENRNVTVDGPFAVLGDGQYLANGFTFEK